MLVTSCCTTSLRSRLLRRFSCGERIWGDRFPRDSRRMRFRLRKSVGRDAFGRRISVRLRSGAGERWDRKAGRRPCFCLGGAVPVRLRASASCVGVVVGLESSGNGGRSVYSYLSPIICVPPHRFTRKVRRSISVSFFQTESSSLKAGHSDTRSEAGPSAGTA